MWGHRRNQFLEHGFCNCNTCKPSRGLLRNGSQGTHVGGATVPPTGLCFPKVFWRAGALALALCLPGCSLLISVALRRDPPLHCSLRLLCFLPLWTWLLRKSSGQVIPCRWTAVIKILLGCFIFHCNKNMYQGFLRSLVEVLAVLLHCLMEKDKNKLILF